MHLSSSAAFLNSAFSSHPHRGCCLFLGVPSWLLHYYSPSNFVLSCLFSHRFCCAFYQIKCLISSMPVVESLLLSSNFAVSLRFLAWASLRADSSASPHPNCQPPTEFSIQRGSILPAPPILLPGQIYSGPHPPVLPQCPGLN